MIFDLGSIFHICETRVCSVSFTVRKLLVSYEKALNQIKIKGLFTSYSSCVSKLPLKHYYNRARSENPK